MIHADLSDIYDLRDTLRRKYLVVLDTEEAHVLHGLGLTLKDAEETCAALAELGNSPAEMKQELLRDAYSLKLLKKKIEGAGQEVDTSDLRI